MPDFAKGTEEERAAVDLPDKVDTYRGFVRALSYVVMVHVALAVPVAMVLFGGTDLVLAAIIGAILLAVGFYSLLRLFRSGARTEGEAPGAERRTVYTAPR